MKYNMYVGGYSSEEASLYNVHFDSELEKLEVVSNNNESLNPVHILIKDHILFSANELDGVARVSSFKIHEDGSLKLINRMDGKGYGTCDITISDNVLYAANYGSGNIFSVVFEDDGILKEVMSNVEHIGKEPRAHSTILSKNKKFLYEANLGLDKIYSYEVYPEGIIRNLPAQKSVSLNPYEGPRHMTISRDGHYLYVINEYGNSIYSYAIHEDNGTLTFVDKLQLVDDVECYSADLHFSRDDKYLYASLRGKDEIAQLFVEDGKMTLINTYSSGGKWPRSFKISDDNEYMFITNQQSNTLVVLKIDQNNGALSDPIGEVEIFRPTTVEIY